MSEEALYADISPNLEHLMKLASDGMLNLGSSGLPRLVFDEVECESQQEG